MHGRSSRQSTQKNGRASGGRRRRGTARPIFVRKGEQEEAATSSPELGTSPVPETREVGQELECHASSEEQRIPTPSSGLNVLAKEFVPAQVTRDLFLNPWLSDDTLYREHRIFLRPAMRPRQEDYRMRGSCSQEEEPEAACREGKVFPQRRRKVSQSHRADRIGLGIYHRREERRSVGVTVVAPDYRTWQ